MTVARLANILLGYCVPLGLLVAGAIEDDTELSLVGGFVLLAVTVHDQTERIREAVAGRVEVHIVRDGEPACVISFDGTVTKDQADEIVARMRDREVRR